MTRIGLWIRFRAQRPRRGIRRLEQYVSYPGTRYLLDHYHQPRKEKP